jgi:[ribosomal protein S18]-alanine N-acetyltransferase
LTTASTSADIVIAAATLRDLDAVAAIESRAFSDPWSRQAFASALQLDASFFACARSRSGAMLGYVVAWFAAGEGEIANLAVDAASRGQGTGGRLLDAAIARASSERVATVYLEVRASNESALRLYRSRGFEEVGRRRSYYRKPTEDAIVFRLQLPKVT